MTKSELRKDLKIISVTPDSKYNFTFVLKSN